MDGLDWLLGEARSLLQGKLVDVAGRKRQDSSVRGVITAEPNQHAKREQERKENYKSSREMDSKGCGSGRSSSGASGGGCCCSGKKQATATAQTAQPAAKSS